MKHFSTAQKTLADSNNFKDEKDLVLPFYAPVSKIVLILDGFDELPEKVKVNYAE